MRNFNSLLLRIQQSSQVDQLVFSDGFLQLGIPENLHANIWLLDVVKRIETLAACKFLPIHLSTQMPKRTL